jgi:hypothetical protein
MFFRIFSNIYSVNTAFCLATFLSNEEPDESTFFTDLKLAGEAETRARRYLKRNLSFTTFFLFT